MSSIILPVNTDPFTPIDGWEIRQISNMDTVVPIMYEGGTEHARPCLIKDTKARKCFLGLFFIVKHQYVCKLYPCPQHVPLAGAWSTVLHATDGTGWAITVTNNGDASGPILSSYSPEWLRASTTISSKVAEVLEFDPYRVVVQEEDDDEEEEEKEEKELKEHKDAEEWETVPPVKEEDDDVVVETEAEAKEEEEVTEPEPEPKQEAEDIVAEAKEPEKKPQSEKIFIVSGEIVYVRPMEDKHQSQYQLVVMYEVNGERRFTTLFAVACVDGCVNLDALQRSSFRPMSVIGARVLIVAYEKSSEKDVAIGSSIRIEDTVLSYSSDEFYRFATAPGGKFEKLFTESVEVEQGPEFVLNVSNNVTGVRSKVFGRFRNASLSPDKYLTRLGSALYAKYFYASDFKHGTRQTRSFPDSVGNFYLCDFYQDKDLFLADRPHEQEQKQVPVL